MKYPIIGLRVLFGGFFVFSGLVKLYPIETFELTFVDLGLVSWKVAPFFARVMIAYEIFLGCALLLNFKIKSTLKQTLLLLVFFTIYLGYLLAVNGNEENCGCFGSQFYITPLQSIVKNILLLGLNLLLIKKWTPRRWRFEWIYFVIIALALATPFILNPVELSTDNLYDVELPYTLDYLDEIPKPIENGEEVNLSKGEKIIALLSLTCEHCKHAAYKLKIASEKHDIPPVYFVFKGTTNPDKVKQLDDLRLLFNKESNSDFPYSYFGDERIFKMAKGIFPTVLHVRDSEVLHVWHGADLSYEEISKLESSLKSN